MLKVHSLSLILLYIFVNTTLYFSIIEEFRTFTNEINVRFNEPRFKNCEVHLSICVVYI